MPTAAGAGAAAADTAAAAAAAAADMKRFIMLHALHETGRYILPTVRTYVRNNIPFLDPKSQSSKHVPICTQI